MGIHVPRGRTSRGDGGERWVVASRGCVIVALSFVVGCASSPTVIEKTRTVTVEVPVVQKLPEQLLSDCAPAYTYPAIITVDAIIDRLVAVETANAACRDQIARIRNAQR